MTLPDYHTHNQRCKHAQGEPVDYALAAKKNGVPTLACTDHAPTPDDQFDLIHRMTWAEYDSYRDAVEHARSASEVDVLYGVEADYYEGCEKVLGQLIDREPFDVVLGSVHYLDYWKYDNPEDRSLWRDEEPINIWTLYFQHIQRMAKTGLYNIASHLDLPKKFGQRLPEKQLREVALPALDSIKESGMAIEINTSGLIHPIGEMYPSPELLSWACDRQIPLTFGSDAHTPNRVGANFSNALDLARDVGYKTRAEFSNRTMTLIEL